MTVVPIHRCCSPAGGWGRGGIGEVYACDIPSLQYIEAISPPSCCPVARLGIILRLEQKPARTLYVNAMTLSILSIAE